VLLLLSRCVIGPVAEAHEALGVSPTGNLVVRVRRVLFGVDVPEEEVKHGQGS